MKNTMDFYNKTAADWAKKGYDKADEIPALIEFAKEFPLGSSFLDVCCGCGYDSARIHALGYAVQGIDFSEESLKIARQRNPDIVFYHDNILHDYSYVGKVDAILVITGLVHITNEELPCAFYNMHKVLKENGRLFVTVREGTGKMTDRSLCEIDNEPYDRNFIGHTKDELILSARGFFYL